MFYWYKRARISKVVALVTITITILKLVPDTLNNFVMINNPIGSMRRTENLIGHIIYWDRRNSLSLLMYQHGKQESEKR